MSTDWLQTYTAAADRRSEDEKRRQERQEMLERQKCEVKFIVWYDPQKQPYRITYIIQHYPRASLSAILPLISNLELSDKSYIELWDFLTRSWTNVTLDSEFDVDNIGETSKAGPQWVPPLVTREHPSHVGIPQKGYPT
ncbi:hypothetical protein PM082_008963 [Marasmius tenuissimus]|nr:hypothetical protein PM082_008963 [Marasmius tenuissimus]